ncbi:MAG TPA: ThuA domain-containing protein [Pirellulales bacterium]|nr:ThuA domain-containing protein [Pirellulales bacterium]
MLTRTSLLALGLALLSTAPVSAEPQLKALIVDGQNNHNWQATTPLLKKHLEDSGLFSVDVATSPPNGQDLSGFQPNFAAYDVVVSNYNGAAWPKATQDALAQFVADGGGLVVVHAADNAFPEWKEYNQMIGVGGWGGRNEKSGPYVRYRDGKFVRDTSPGGGGSHGSQHPFVVVVRDAKHPITAGLPSSWLHAADELYDRLRGPAENMTVLATAYADKAEGGSGEHEPMLMVIDYGKGRVFHSTLGHSPEAMKCVGFIVTLQRGAEWAATGKVAPRELPNDFPTADKTSVRK